MNQSNTTTTTTTPRFITEADIDRWLAGAPLRATGSENEKSDEKQAA